MAAYGRVNDCGLTACTAERGPNVLGNEYGKPLPFSTDNRCWLDLCHECHTPSKLDRHCDNFNTTIM